MAVCKEALNKSPVSQDIPNAQEKIIKDNQ